MFKTVYLKIKTFFNKVVIKEHSLLDANVGIILGRFLNRDDQEIAILALRLLQICMVYINTLLVQKVLSEKEWLDKMQPEDLRGLTPLFYGHIAPYGEFQLDTNKRINIEGTI